jgi:TRAP-type C4-dicarboxylate transport system permease small subunit
LKKLFDTLCGLLCGGALFAIMALTFFDVGGRKFLDRSIPGSFELTELLMVVVIFAGLPLVSQRGEHVVFDAMDSYLPAWALKAQIAFVHALCAVAMLALGWLLWDSGNQFLASGETTAFCLRHGCFVRLDGPCAPGANLQTRRPACRG